MYLNGHGIEGKDPRGGAISDDHFLLYFNADGPADITLPPDEYAPAWDVIVNTGGAADDADTCAAGSTLHVEHRSLIVLREHSAPELEVDHSVAASVAAQAARG